MVPNTCHTVLDKRVTQLTPCGIQHWELHVFGSFNYWTHWCPAYSINMYQHVTLASSLRGKSLARGFRDIWLERSSWSLETLDPSPWCFSLISYFLNTLPCLQCNFNTLQFAMLKALRSWRRNKQEIGRAPWAKPLDPSAALEKRWRMDYGWNMWWNVQKLSLSFHVLELSAAIYSRSW